jgi:hypothetical protein
MRRLRGTNLRISIKWLLAVSQLLAFQASATIIWSDEGSRVIHETGVWMGVDILGGAVKRDDASSDALYFKFHVDPLSDVASEPYYAGFQLFEGNIPRLGVGNAEEAWGYSAFNTAETGPMNQVAGEYNLKSSHPEAAELGKLRPYEIPRHDHERTIIFKVQYVPKGDDIITAWLNPNLGRGATEKNQPESLTTKFRANASFNQIRLRHGGGGNGWIFSDMAVATSFRDFVVVHFWQTWWFMAISLTCLLVGVGATVRFVEKKKYQYQLKRAEQVHALERERARIAQDLHDDLGCERTKTNPIWWKRTRSTFPKPPTRPSARSTKLCGPCGPAAIRFKACWTTSCIFPTNYLPTVQLVAGSNCRVICPRWHCRLNFDTTFF